MKHLVFFAFLQLAVLLPCAARAQTVPALYPYSDHLPVHFWGTGSLNIAENNFEAALELSARLPRPGVVFSVQHVRKLPDVIFETDTPIEDYSMTNAFVGAGMGNLAFYTRLSAGAGYLTGIEHVGWNEDELSGWLSSTGNFPRRRFGHVNVPIRLEGMLKPVRVGGFGLAAQYNLNPTHSFLSFSVTLSMGLMP